jgi:hypothetical protein
MAITEAYFMPFQERIYIINVHIFVIFGKENCSPSKSGIYFCLELGRSNVLHREIIIIPTDYV